MPWTSHNFFRMEDLLKRVQSRTNWNETHPYKRIFKTCGMLYLHSDAQVYQRLPHRSWSKGEDRPLLGGSLCFIPVLSLLLATPATLERTIFGGTARETAQQLHQQLDAGHHKLAIYVRRSGAVRLTDVTACLSFKGKLDSIDEAEDLINEVESTATWQTHGLAWVAAFPQTMTLKRRTRLQDLTKVCKTQRKSSFQRLKDWSALRVLLAFPSNRSCSPVLSASGWKCCDLTGHAAKDKGHHGCRFQSISSLTPQIHRIELWNIVFLLKLHHVSLGLTSGLEFKDLLTRYNWHMLFLETGRSSRWKKRERPGFSCDQNGFRAWHAGFLSSAHLQL